MFFKIGVFKNFTNFIGKHQCWSIFRSSCSQVFFKIGVLKYFTIFTEKSLCRNLFLIKLQAWRPTTLTKSNFYTGVFLWTVRMFPNFQEQFSLYNTSDGCFCIRFEVTGLKINSVIKMSRSCPKQVFSCEICKVL